MRKTRRSVTENALKSGKNAPEWAVKSEKCNRNVRRGGSVRTEKRARRGGSVKTEKRKARRKCERGSTKDAAEM